MSLPPAAGVQWVRVETTLVIDDDPDDTGFGWDVAGQGYKVDMIEEVRATFFIGDFTGNFPSPATMAAVSSSTTRCWRFFQTKRPCLDATPNPNPMPVAGRRRRLQRQRHGRRRRLHGVAQSLGQSAARRWRIAHRA